MEVVDNLLPAPEAPAAEQRPDGGAQPLRRASTCITRYLPGCSTTVVTPFQALDGASSRTPSARGAAALSAFFGAKRRALPASVSSPEGTPRATSSSSSSTSPSHARTPSSGRCLRGVLGLSVRGWAEAEEVAEALGEVSPASSSAAAARSFVRRDSGSKGGPEEEDEPVGNRLTLSELDEQVAELLSAWDAWTQSGLSPTAGGERRAQLELLAGPVNAAAAWRRLAGEAAAAPGANGGPQPPPRGPPEPLRLEGEAPGGCRLPGHTGEAPGEEGEERETTIAKAAEGGHGRKQQLLA